MIAKALLQAVALAGAVSMFAPDTWAQKARPDFGRREFQSNCASCHGAGGKGDGPYKPFLNRSPADLTVLGKANKGVFPYERVYQVIDGRQEVPAHGKRDMPIWGADYLTAAASDYMDVPYDAEAYVRTRIIALIDYIHRLQAK